MDVSEDWCKVMQIGAWIVGMLVRWWRRMGRVSVRMVKNKNAGLDAGTGPIL